MVEKFSTTSDSWLTRIIVVIVVWSNITNPLRFRRCRRVGLRFLDNHNERTTADVISHSTGSIFTTTQHDPHDWWCAVAMVAGISCDVCNVGGISSTASLWVAACRVTVSGRFCDAAYVWATMQVHEGGRDIWEKAEGLESKTGQSVVHREDSYGWLNRTPESNNVRKLFNISFAALLFQLWSFSYSFSYSWFFFE